MWDPEKRWNSQWTWTFSPSEVIEYREQQKKLAEEQSIIDAKQKELDTINREINDINAQKILAQKEGDHRNQHDQLYKDHEALLKALEDSYGSYNQAESSLKTKTATAGHRNDLESNLTQKEKNWQKILTDITKVEKEINQKRNADWLPEVDFDAIHNQVNKRPIKSGTWSNKPSWDIVGQKHTDAPMTGLVWLDGRPLSATKVESRVASDKAEQVIGTSEQINKGEIAPKPEWVVDWKDVKANDNQKINEQVALDNAVTIQKWLEAANKAAWGEVVVEKIKPNIQIESTTWGDIVEIDYLWVKNTKVKVIETLADGSKVVEFTEQTVSNKAWDRKTISQQTWETLKPKEVTKWEKLTDQSDTKMEPTKENIELSNSKIEALQNKYHELATEISNNKDPLKRPKLLAELKAVSKELESARKELLGIGDVPVVIENPELTSAKNLSQKLGERIKDEKDPVKRESLEDQKQKLDERVKSEEEKQKQDEQKKITEEQKQENKESQETTKSKLDAKKSEYSNLASQIEIAKLAEKTPENKQKVADLEQKIRDNVREVQDLKYQELVERYPEHAQTYKDWKSAQEQYGKAREDYFKDLADPSKEMSDTQYTEARKNMYDLERKLRDLSWKDLSQEMKQKSEKKFQDDITLIDERYNLAMENSAYKLNQKLWNTDATIPVEIEKNSQRIAEIDKKLGTKSALFDEHKRIDDAIDSRIENAWKDVNGKESSDSKEKKKKEEGSRVLNFIKWLKLRVGWAIPVWLWIMGAAYACSDKE